VPRASEPLAVPAGAVHLWWADLDRMDQEECVALLDAAERERHERFRFERDRARFAGRRALLRRVLAAYTGLAAQAVPVAVTAAGKPFSSALDGLDFSCSSSRPLAVVALGAYERLGVDVEYRPDGSWEAFPVRRYLSTGEIAALEGLGEEEATRRAARAWVLKEAIAKAVGTGLSLPPGEIELAGEPARPDLRLGGPWAEHASEGWRAGLVEDDPTRVAAVAVDGVWHETVARTWPAEPSIT
jgi:4'-phosphopantetheinyl transferase